MAALAGRKTLIKVSTTSGGTYNTVKNVSSGTIAINGTQIDISEFGDTYKNNLRGLLDASVDLSGNWDSTDTNGQIVIRTGYLSDTSVFLQFLPDGATGYQMQLQVTKWAIDAAVDKAVGLSISGSQTGGITLI